MGLAVATAQNPAPEPAAPAGEDSGGGMFSGGLLPNGSILKNAVMPSYDDQLNLASSITAAELTIHTREEIRADARTGIEKTVEVLDKIDAKQLRIRFFNPDRSPKGDIAMAKAVFQSRKDLDLLTSQEPVTFASDDLNVNGSALAFDTRRNRGFLHGPVTAIARTTDLSTSMNATPARGMIAAGALLMAAAPAQQTPTAPTAAPAISSAERIAKARLSEADLATLAAEKASRAPLQAAQATAAAADREQVQAASADARVTMNSFLRAAALTPLLAQPAEEAATPDVPRPDFKEAPDSTTIHAKNGAYFDSEEGLLIFLGETTVKNPQLDLKGATEVKLFLEPKPPEATADATKPANPNAPPLTAEQLEKMKAAKAAEAAKEAPATPEQLEKMRAAKEQKAEPTAEQLEKLKAARLALGLKEAVTAEKGGKGGQFGDAKKLVATGPAVHIRYSSGKPGDQPVEAMAHTVVYDFEKQTILLEGGSPWAIQEGVMRAEAVGKGAYILVYTDEDSALTRMVTHNPGGGFKLNFKTPEDEDKKPKEGQPKNR